MVLSDDASRYLRLRRKLLPPTLVDVNKDGVKIPAVAQITKQGLLFILNRETGVPVFGVEERPVPASDAPGEQTWPTQPFPLKPVPLAKNVYDPR